MYFLSFVEKEKSEYTTKEFLNALKSDFKDDAKAYISRDFVNSIDLHKYENITKKQKIPFVICANYDKLPKNCKLDTIMTTDTEIFHLYMLKEPDKFGKWKIYGIDRE
ncbi:MAG: hypothetical protein FWD82_10340 [Defluviitaleaceae bacterium]|nr:hypothetical protein [Defluviitaleaceae bacterium]